MNLTVEKSRAIDSELMLTEAQRIAREAKTAASDTSAMATEHRIARQQLESIGPNPTGENMQIAQQKTYDRYKQTEPYVRGTEPQAKEFSVAPPVDLTSKSELTPTPTPILTDQTISANTESAFVEAQLEAPINPNEQRGSEVFQKATELAQRLEAAGLQFETFRDPDGKHFTFAIQKPVETRNGRERTEQLNREQLIDDLRAQYLFQDPTETPDQQRARRDALVDLMNTHGEFARLVDAEKVRNPGFYQEFERPRQGFFGQLKERVGGWFQKKAQETRPARPEQPTKPETEKINLVKEAKKGIDRIFAWGRKKIEESNAAKEAKVDAIRLEEMTRDWEQDTEARVAEFAEVGTVARPALDRIDLAVSAEKRLGAVKEDIDRIAAEDGANSVRREKLQEKVAETRSRIRLIEIMLRRLEVTSERIKLERTREIAQRELQEADMEIGILTRRLEAAQRSRGYLEADRGQIRQELSGLGRTTLTENSLYNPTGRPGGPGGPEISPLRAEQGTPNINAMTQEEWNRIRGRAETQMLPTPPYLPEVAPLSADARTRMEAQAVREQTADEYRQVAEQTDQTLDERAGITTMNPPLPVFRQPTQTQEAKYALSPEPAVDVTSSANQAAGPAANEPGQLVDVTV